VRKRWPKSFYPCKEEEEETKTQKKKMESGFWGFGSNLCRLLSDAALRCRQTS
jgi:hypothetical protein